MSRLVVAWRQLRSDAGPLLTVATVLFVTALLSTIQALAYGVYSRDADQYADRIKAFRLK